MRRVLTFLIVCVLLTPAPGAPLSPAVTTSSDAGLRLIKNYRAKPYPAAVPAMIRSLSERGAFKDPDTSGVYVGFLAGVLRANPDKAQALIAKILPLPFEDQWIVIRAVAYSGLPNWRDLMRGLAARLPNRQVMAERYLTGKLPTLDQVALEPERRTTMDRVKSFFTAEAFFSSKKPAQRQLTVMSNPEMIDTYWGYYFATGREGPILRILALLPWSHERDSVEKLTVGSMAKFTLAANASRDAELLALLKRISSNQPKDVEPVLKEVIEAAETVDTGRIGKEALAAVEELRKKGPSSTRDIAWWGQAGEAALSLGCLGLALTGQVEFGIPCVVGGALTSAGLRYLGKPE
jgi:hypothetical protein